MPGSAKHRLKKRDPDWGRTSNRWLRRQVLYPLSYGTIFYFSQKYIFQQVYTTQFFLNSFIFTLFSPIYSFLPLRCRVPGHNKRPFSHPNQP